MSSVLVTGASGFIGNHLVSALRLAGYSVVEMGAEHGDITREATWRNVPPTDAVVHLAGRPFVPDSWEDPVGVVEGNMIGTMRALDYARRNGAHFVFLSSYLYGAPRSLPIPETAPIAATNPYALSKKLAEDACRFYAAAHNLTVTVLRPFNVYGPGQAAKFVIPSIVEQVRGGTEVRVKDLDPRRDYVYVADVVAVIVAALACQPSGFATYNVGTGVSHSVRELIDIIQDVFGTRLPVVSEGQRRPDEVMDTVADIGLARSELRWTPNFDLRAGITALRDSARAR